MTHPARALFPTITAADWRRMFTHHRSGVSPNSLSRQIASRLTGSRPLNKANERAGACENTGQISVNPPHP